MNYEKINGCGTDCSGDRRLRGLIESDLHEMDRRKRRRPTRIPVARLDLRFEERTGFQRSIRTSLVFRESQLETEGLVTVGRFQRVFGLQGAEK